MIKKVFLITVDDLRADRTGYVNKNSSITPNINSFAENSISFTQAIATGPMTPLSFPGILNSEYPSRFFNKSILNKLNLASIFQEHGYVTSAFNSNPHFNNWGFSKGFDYFNNFLDNTFIQRERKIEKLKKKFVKVIGQNNVIIAGIERLFTHLSLDIALPYADAKMTTLNSLEWINKNKNKDFFCWIHFMDPHYPFLPKKEFQQQKINDKEIFRLNRIHKFAEKNQIKLKTKDISKLISLYNAEIIYFDVWFGKLIKEIKDLHLFKESIIIVCSDHGELFGDYGNYGHRQDILYQNQLHVPLIIKNDVNKKMTIKHPVSLVDIPKTVLEIAHMESIFENRYNLINEKREYIISESIDWKNIHKKESKNITSEMKLSCQHGDWKIIIDLKNNKKELFNLNEDKFETSNIYKRNLKVAKKLEIAVLNHLMEIENRKKKIISNKIMKLIKKGKI